MRKRIHSEKFEDELKEKEIPLVLRKKIVLFVSTHKDLNDYDFHRYAKSLGLNTHEAEEVVYDTIYSWSRKI